MGPCRISAKADGKMQRSVCGADADVIVARNFGRFIAGGSAGHSDHGRDLVEVLEAIVEGETSNYAIRDADKLFALATEMKIPTADREVMRVAKDVLDVCFADFGSRQKELSFMSRVPAKRKEIWRKLNLIPRGVDREVTEMMHRTHMGCDNDAASTLIHAARTALADGWGGSRIGTELSDVIFGAPSPKISTASLGVSRDDKVNILVHGHEPVVSAFILISNRQRPMPKPKRLSAWRCKAMPNGIARGSTYCEQSGLEILHYDDPGPYISRPDPKCARQMRNESWPSARRGAAFLGLSPNIVKQAADMNKVVAGPENAEVGVLAPD